MATEQTRMIGFGSYSRQSIVVDQTRQRTLEGLARQPHRPIQPFVRPNTSANLASHSQETPCTTPFSSPSSPTGGTSHAPLPSLGHWYQ